MKIIPNAEEKIEARIEEITPSRAAEDLARVANPNNRGIRRSRIGAYVADMLAGRWRVNNQGIGYSADGMLIDGHHRLTAVVESGVAVKMLVVRGLEAPSVYTIDKGATRTTADNLSMDKIENASRKTSAVRMILTGILSGHSRMVTEGETRDMLLRFSSSIEAALAAFPSTRGVGQVPVVAAFAWAWNRDPAIVSGCADQLRDGLGLVRDQPMATLRHYLVDEGGALAAGDSQQVRTRKVLRALMAAVCRNTLPKITEHRESIRFFAEANGYDPKSLPDGSTESRSRPKESSNAT